MKVEIDFLSIKGSYPSKHLNRNVKFRWVAPGNYKNSNKPFKVLLMNDGQDFISLNLEQSLTSAFRRKDIQPFIYVGLECDKNRMFEYGIASSADYKGRGNKAEVYSKFVIEEFIPFLKEEYNVSNKGLDWIFCGLSLGGLSALDIVVNHPDHFGKAGVFSGSFWWRNKPYKKEDLSDRSRIILEVINNAPYAPHLDFWFQCGTEDEKADRNHNGIIDAIDDTLDVIRELKAKGYTYPGDISYVEVIGGKHNLPTWANVIPQFLQWAFGFPDTEIKIEKTA